MRTNESSGLNEENREYHPMTEHYAITARTNDIEYVCFRHAFASLLDARTAVESCQRAYPDIFGYAIEHVTYQPVAWSIHPQRSGRIVWRQA